MRPQDFLRIRAALEGADVLVLVPHKFILSIPQYPTAGLRHSALRPEWSVKRLVLSQDSSIDA
jgi:hypothetical protein